MNVALPELDGRVFTRAVSFKADDHWDAATQCRIVTYRPVADRVAFVADLAAAWIGLRRTKPAKRRLALILANYPNRDGRIGNGHSGQDAVRSAKQRPPSLPARLRRRPPPSRRPPPPEPDAPRW